MAITQSLLSVTFTATNDSVTLGWARPVVGMTFQGTGLTSGQRLTVRNKATVGAGSILADYITETTAENADLWVGRERQRVYALSMDNTILAGTWALTVFLGDGIEDA
jgi:hypothetical protein